MGMACFCESEGEVETGACTLVGTAGEWEAWTACSILTGGASRTRACLGPPGSEGDNRPVVCEDLPADERECTGGARGTASLGRWSPSQGNGKFNFQLRANMT